MASRISIPERKKMSLLTVNMIGRSSQKHWKGNSIGVAHEYLYGDALVIRAGAVVVDSRAGVVIFVGSKK
jgi:hypothetical protein